MNPWPADKVERWPLDKIIPYPNNPRTHSPEQVAQLARDMKADGVTMPILIDEAGVIIAGHGRRLAAEPEYPVVIACGWNEAQKRAVRLKDNQLTLLSDWDYDLLRLELTELKAADFDLASLAFDPATLGWLIAGNTVQDANGEWTGMPGFEQPAAGAFRSIIVHFNDQAGVDRFERAISQRLPEKVKFMWYPEIIIKPFLKVSSSK